MLPFYINGIWLIGSERRSELSEICAELLLSHSCFNSSRGGRGNSSMYAHSFLQTWHGWRSNVFEFGEWLPEQSTHSTAAPLLHGCLWWACGFRWKRLSKSFVWQNHRGVWIPMSFMGYFLRIKKTVSRETWSSHTWVQHNPILFTFTSFLSSFEMAYRECSIHHLRISASEKGEKWASTQQIWKVILIAMPDWYCPAALAQICSGENHRTERVTAIVADVGVCFRKHIRILCHPVHANNVHVYSLVDLSCWT